MAIAWLAERELKTGGQNLGSVLDQMGLADRFTAHRAVEDARAAAAVLQMHHLGRVPG